MQIIQNFIVGTILTLAIPCSAALPAAGAAWFEFRGPTAQGLAPAKKAPLKWSANENVKWKAPIPGGGWSSPVVVGNRIYLTTAVSESSGLSLRVLCLHAMTGNVMWNVEVFSPAQTKQRTSRIHRKNTHASPTPYIEDQRLYVHFGHQGTACLDLQGKVLWKNRDLDYPPVHGGGSSPVIVGNHLIFSCDGARDPFLVALDKGTGSLRWKTPRTENASKKFSFCTPLVIDVKGQTQIISPASDMVGGYDPATGRELWKVRYDGYSVVPRPVYGHGLIFISTGFDRPQVMAIRPDGKGDVTESHVTWTLGKGGPKTPSLLLVDQELYMVSDSGIASCVDAQTGRVHYQERVGGNYSASPVHVNGNIFFQSEEGKGVVIKAGKRFEILSQNELGERSLASYAMTGSDFLIRTEEHLFRIGDR